MLIFWALVVVGVVWAVRSSRRPPTRSSAGTAAQTLDLRFARGEITKDEFHRRHDLLAAPVRTPRSSNLRLLFIAVPAVLLLAAGSTVAVAASQGGFGQQNRSQAVACAVPRLPGATVAVTLVDVGLMGGMMSGGQSSWEHFQPGMMRVTASPVTVARGRVSLQVMNEGVITHELVVLPLAPGQDVGARSTGEDGRVAEDSSVGEASNNCAADSGEGITSGGSGWTTLSLAPGRYELLCNLPGHYHAGMFAEVDVS